MSTQRQRRAVEVQSREFYVHWIAESRPRCMSLKNSFTWLPCLRFSCAFFTLLFNADVDSLQLPSKDVNNAGYKVDMMLASVNADFHADKDVTVPRPYYLHLCTGESGGRGPINNLWSGLFCGPANPATQPNQPWQESRYKCQSLWTAAPALSSAFYRAALTVHNCGIETFPLIAENKLRRTWRNFLGVFSLSSTPQFQNSDSGAIDFYRTQVSLGSGLWVSASLCPYVQDFWLKLCQLSVSPTHLLLEVKWGGEPV